MKAKLFVVIGLFLFLSIQLSAMAGPYEQCIKDNLGKAKTVAAVKLLKEICATEDKQPENLCKNKKPADFTNEELCKCLHFAYDPATKKCQ